MQVPRGAEWEKPIAASGAKTRRMQRKYREKFANRSCNAKIAVLQYARSITFPKASGKAGYIGKLPCGGFSKDCKLERTNRLRRAGGNIISIGTVPPDFRRHCFLHFREKQNVQTFLWFFRLAGNNDLVPRGKRKTTAPRKHLGWTFCVEISKRFTSNTCRRRSAAR